MRFLSQFERNVRHFVRGKLLGRPNYQPPPAGLFNYNWPLSGQISEADRLIWNGFPDAGDRLIREIMNAPKATDATRAYGLWSLARRHYQSGDFIGCLSCLNEINGTDYREDFGEAFCVLRLECLINVKGPVAADAEQAWIPATGDADDASFCFLHAWHIGQTRQASHEHRASVLAALNRPYIGAGLVPLGLRDEQRPLSISNLTSEASAGSVHEQTKLSVIMPAYNCEATLQTAVAGIIAQTYRNFELLIVDDFSSDATYTIASRLAADDDRIKVDRHSENLGAYAARNTALRCANGAYVTVHDPDDWSHPQLFETQMRAVETQSGIASVMCLLVGEDLRPVLRPDIASALVPSAPSLVYPTETLKALGGWLETRVGSDTEMLERSIVLGESITDLGDGAPMVFQLMQKGSLTNTAATNLRTIQYGLRKDVLEAQRHWHACFDGDRQQLHSSCAPVLPAPELISSKRISTNSDFEIMHIADFAAPDASIAATTAMLKSINSLGYHQAVYHWPDIKNADRPKAGQVQNLLNTGFVRQIVPQEACECDLLIVHDLDCLADRPAYLPRIAAQRAVAIVQSGGTLQRGKSEDQGSLQDLLSEFEDILGVEPSLAPASCLVRNALTANVKDEEVIARDWLPLIEPDTLGAPRRPLARAPIVGRTSSDSDGGWPKNVRALRQSGLAGSQTEFRVRGGDLLLERRLQTPPPNWKVQSTKSIAAHDFLVALDFFAYFPGERLELEDLAAPIQAMACGVPVIVPHEYRSVFEDAAAYSKPSEVKRVIERLWRSEADYAALSQAGLTFAGENAALTNMKMRLADLGMSKPSRPDT